MTVREPHIGGDSRAPVARRRRPSTGAPRPADSTRPQHSAPERTGSSRTATAQSRYAHEDPRPEASPPLTSQQNGSRQRMPQHTSGSDRTAAPPAARGSGTVRPPAPSSLDELWRSYKATGDERLREQLILHYSPLVKYVAGRVSVGLPPNVEQADFVSSGVFGLIDAIEKFDIERAIKFETYAITRIRGAMIDELRALDWIPRSVRQKARAVERAYATLEAQLQTHPLGGRGRRRDGHRASRNCTPSSASCRSPTWSPWKNCCTSAARAATGSASWTPWRTPPPTTPSKSPRTANCAGCSPAPSTRSPNARRPSSRSTTTKASPSPRSATCSASPRAGSARSTPSRCSSCRAKLADVGR